MSEIILHGYWRSSASYRLRIALNLQGLDYRQITHDLRRGAHKDDGSLAIVPHGLVRAIVNIVLGRFHRGFDAPPFSILQGVAQLAALYITVSILITSGSSRNCPIIANS